MRFAISAMAAISGLLLLGVAFYGQPATYLHQAREEWNLLLDNPPAEDPADPDRGAAAGRVALLQQQVALLEDELAKRQAAAAKAIPPPTVAPPAVAPQTALPQPAAPAPVPALVSQPQPARPEAPYADAPHVEVPHVEARQPDPVGPRLTAQAVQPLPPAIVNPDRRETAVAAVTASEPAPAKADLPRPAPLKLDLPKLEPPKTELAKFEPPKPEPPKPEPPKAEVARPEPPKADPVIAAQPKPEPARTEPPRPDPRPEPGPVKTELVRTELVKAESPKVTQSKSEPVKPPPQMFAMAKPIPPPVSPPSPARADDGDTQSVLARLRQLGPGPAPARQPEPPPAAEPKARPAPSPTVPGLTLARTALANGRIEDARRLLQQAQLQLVFRPIDASGDDSPGAAQGAADVAHALDALSANDVPLGRRYTDAALGDLSGGGTNPPIQETRIRATGYAPAYPPR